MKRFVMLILFTFLTVAVSFGQQWPTNPNNLAFGFGRAVDGQFGRGLIFRSDGEEVSAWNTGDVVWVSSSQSPLIVLEHENGFRSIYRGIVPNSNLPNHVIEGESIGFSKREEWVFEILDNQSSWIVSPLSVLPARKKVPSLKILSVSIEKGLERITIENDLSFRADSWDIVVDCGSFNTKQSIPVELSLYWEDELLDILNMETFVIKEGRTITNLPVEKIFSRVYKDKTRFFFPRIKLDAREGTLRVRIRDEYGDIISQSWNLKIR